LIGVFRARFLVSKWSGRYDSIEFFGRAESIHFEVGRERDLAAFACSTPHFRKRPLRTVSIPKQAEDNACKDKNRQAQNIKGPVKPVLWAASDMAKVQSEKSG
jgi:hypothetical protein